MMGLSTAVVPALFLGFGGFVAYLAGVVALAQTRRLRRVGIPVQALVKHRPAVRGDTSGRSGPLLQFATESGGVMEVFSPAGSTRSRPLVDGHQVLIAYDPDDPRQVVLPGRERRAVDYAFVGLGVCLMLTAAVVLFLPA
jgi:hypothetical protein